MRNLCDQADNIPGIRLHALRRLYGFTLRDVADSLHLSESTISRYESFRRKTARFPRHPETLQALAAMYGVSTDFILGHTDDDPGIAALPESLSTDDLRHRLTLGQASLVKQKE